MPSRAKAKRRGSNEIPAAVLGAVESLSPRALALGTTCDARTLQRILREAGYAGPHRWMVALLSKFPLAGLRFRVHVTDVSARYDNEPLDFRIADQATLRDLNVTSYPGHLLSADGFLTIGHGVEGAGDVVMIGPTGEDPAVYQVWHDVSQHRAELLRAIKKSAAGTRILTGSLSDFLSRVLTT
jgi:hypothetical protein